MSFQSDKKRARAITKPIAERHESVILADFFESKQLSCPARNSAICSARCVTYACSCLVLPAESPIAVLCMRRSAVVQEIGLSGKPRDLEFARASTFDHPTFTCSYAFCGMLGVCCCGGVFVISVAVAAPPLVTSRCLM